MPVRVAPGGAAARRDCVGRRGPVARALLLAAALAVAAACERADPAESAGTAGAADTLDGADAARGAATAAAGAERDGTADAEGALPRVATVNHPLAYFAGRIGGGHVAVVFPGEGAGDPAFWMPERDDVALYQSADLILLNGAGYAHWLDKVSLPVSRQVDTSVAFADRLIAVDDAVTHSHGESGEHSHAGTAFTTWLDPTLALEHARAIAAAFTARWPEHRADFEAGLAALAADLTRLDERLAQITAGAGDQPLLGSHPVYQYLARRYALDLRAVHWEPDAVPGDDALAELDAALASHPARWMLWEAEPLPETERLLAERGIRCAVYDPCAQPPAEGDWLTVMHDNARRLATALE